jgi:diphthamide synthase (EF-2-diphthine--ammonia ligase)
MAIHLITADERLEWQYEGSTFYYKRITSSEQKKIEMGCTNRGNTDTREVADQILELCIVGWDNVVSGGVVVPYNKALVRMLPEEVKTAFLARVYEANPQSAELKNSSGISTAKSD